MKKHSKRGAILAGLLFLAGLAILFVAMRNAQAAGDASGPWGFATSNLDKTCKPCDDFYQFAMGGWRKNNPIPPEYPRWGAFSALAERNQDAMREILDAAVSAKAAAGSNEQKIGDFYA